MRTRYAELRAAMQSCSMTKLLKGVLHNAHAHMGVSTELVQPLVAARK